MAFLVQSSGEQIQSRILTAFNAGASAAGIPVSNTGPGGSIGAVFNAIMTESVDIQRQIAYATALGRLQTSASTVPGVNSPDVDSFFAQFGFTRNAGGYASTQTVWTAPTAAPVGGLFVAVGTICQAAPNTQFAVIADPTQSGFSASLNGYVMAAGATTVTCTVRAVNPGTSGNVSSNSIVQILSLPNAPAPVGITAVTNPSAVDNGAAEESDADAIARFQAWMQGRWANPAGVSAAVEGAENGLTFQIGDMLDPSGNITPNFFSVIANVAGTNGAPSTEVLTAINAAVLANRPTGMPYTVVGPTLVPIAVAASLTLLPSAVAATVLQNATNAVSAYLNGIGVAQGIYTDPSTAGTIAKYAEVSSILLNTPGVSNVVPETLTLNGTTDDVLGAFGQELVAGTISLTAA